MRARGLAVVLSFVAVAVADGAARAQTQDLGHKTLGTLGLDAGSQQPTGVYALDAIGAYRADRIVDRNGVPVPIGVEATAFVNVFGVSGSYELPRLGTFVGAAFTAPVARVSLNTDDPRASLDDFGFGDLYVQPLRLGWKPWGNDLGVGYGFYAPTGHRAPGGTDGVGAGQWTHQLSAGGTVYFDRGRRWRLSALASYDRNERKLDRDLRRGDTVQLQGGAGARLGKLIELGVVGYGLWQVMDDEGSAVPPLLAGARDVDYGLGAELDVNVTALRCKLTARYTHDVVARSRPVGGLVFVALAFSVWSAR